MSATQSTDAEEMQRGGDGVYHDYVKADFARDLERENARLRDAMNEARQYVEAYALNVDAPGGVTGGESLLTKIDDILTNAASELSRTAGGRGAEKGQANE